MRKPNNTQSLHLLFLLFISPFAAASQPPVLNFSDLISGPSSGLNDGKGSGVIVTVWGQNLGSSQGDSTISFIDSEGKASKAAHVYYWKNADGQLPSGPANLHESHKMQEIAFSIPEAIQGQGNIQIMTEGGTTTLPFTVRNGEIYHVTSAGDDSSGNGSFAKPWKTVGKADSTINAGSTLYVHDVSTGDENTVQVIYNNRLEAMSSLDAQFSYVAYPDTRPESIGERGFSTYAGGKDLTAGFVMSKFSIYSAEADENEKGQPVNVRANVSMGIEGTRDGRAVGNFITDAHPSDVTGACPDAQQAAITAGAQATDRVSNFKMLGNHIKDYGCEGTTRFHHTTYFTIRSAGKNRQLVAPEIAWNYLQDNMAIGGIHYYDENTTGVECGQFTTTFKIHNNVIINQAGAAIAYGAVCPVNTPFDIYQNVAINSGLISDHDNEGGQPEGTIYNALVITSADAATSVLNIHDNLFYKWNDDDAGGQLTSCIGLYASADGVTIKYNNNICLTDKDKPFIGSSYLGPQLEDNFTGKGNTWHSTAAGADNAAPSWDSAPIGTNPMINIAGALISLDEKSPLLEQSTTDLTRDIYGTTRNNDSAIGPVTPDKSPASPSNINVK